MLVNPLVAGFGYRCIPPAKSSLGWIVGTTAAILGAVILMPLAQFGRLHADDVAVTVLAGLGLALALEGVKSFLNRSREPAAG